MLYLKFQTMKAKTFFSFIIFTALFSLLNAQIHSEGIVIRYPFNEDAMVENGNVNHWSINGQGFTYKQFDEQNSVFIFDGISNYIEITYSETLEVGYTKTVAFWILPYILDGRAGILYQNDTNRNQIFAKLTQRLQWEMDANSTLKNINSDDDYVEVAEWQFLMVVITIDGTETTVKIYNNGEFIREGINTTIVKSKTTNYFIGAARKLPKVVLNL